MIFESSRNDEGSNLAFGFSNPFEQLAIVQFAIPHALFVIASLTGRLSKLHLRVNS